jgi:hypothetical protein
MSKNLRGGFNSSRMKAQIRTVDLLPAGEHPVVITGVEFEMPQTNPHYNHHESEKQAKVMMRNREGMISVWANSIGFAKDDKIAELTDDDFNPAKNPGLGEIDYKKIGTTKTEFAKMTKAAKIKALCNVAPDGFLVRKDDGTRLASIKATQAACEITEGLLGAAGVDAEEEWDESNLGDLLTGKAIRVKVVEEIWNGETKLKVSPRFKPAKEEDIEVLEGVA